jgi:hypothetical protein
VALFAAESAAEAGADAAVVVAGAVADFAVSAAWLKAGGPDGAAAEVLVVGAAGAVDADCPFGADAWLADGGDEACGSLDAGVAILLAVDATDAPAEDWVTEPDALLATWPAVSPAADAPAAVNSPQIQINNSTKAPNEPMPLSRCRCCAERHCINLDMPCRHRSKPH